VQQFSITSLHGWHLGHGNRIGLGESAIRLRIETDLVNRNGVTAAHRLKGDSQTKAASIDRSGKANHQARIHAEAIQLIQSGNAATDARRHGIAAICGSRQVDPQAGQLA